MVAGERSDGFSLWRDQLLVHQRRALGREPLDGSACVLTRFAVVKRDAGGGRCAACARDDWCGGRQSKASGSLGRHSASSNRGTLLSDAVSNGAAAMRRTMGLVRVCVHHGCTFL